MGRFKGLAAAAVGIALVLVACAADEADVVEEAPDAAEATEAPEAPEEAEAPDEEAAPVVLRVGQVDDVADFDPYTLAVGNWQMFHQLYDVLIGYNEQGEPEARLAQDWQISDDASSITLELREGVEFHSGREFVADDVVFSLEYATDEEVGANVGFLASRVENVVVEDDYTVVLEFDGPFPAMMDMFDLLFIIDREHVESEGMGSSGSGTGPFVLEEWRPGESVIFVRNDGYWEGPPALERIELVILPDPDSLIIQLETGAIDWAARTQLQSVPELEADPDLQVGAGPLGAGVLNVVVNVEDPLFEDPAVREVIDLAIDRERIVDDLMMGLSEPWCLPVPSTSLAYFADLDDCAYDLDRAEQVMIDAGYEDGFEFDLMTSSAIVAEQRSIGEILQADLAQIGVTANVVDLDAADYRNRRGEGEYQAHVHTYGRSQKDPDSLFGTTAAFRPGGNASNYADPDYEDVVVAASVEPDPDVRVEFYREAVEMIRADRFVLPIAPNVIAWAARNDVQGTTFSLDGMPQFRNTQLN